jgi:hypothetical protein
MAPLALGSCIDEGERFVVPYRAASRSPASSTGGAKDTGGSPGSGGEAVDSGSGGAPGSGGAADSGSGGSDGALDGSSGGHGGDGGICGCPPISPLTPCCTTQRTCGYIVGAGCFPYVPASGGRDAGHDATMDSPPLDGNLEASPDGRD